MAGSARLVVGNSSAPDASILIATRQDGARLERCLAAIAAHTSDVAYEVVLVLNGADPDVREIAQRLEGATVLSCESNVGFPAAANLARRHAAADHLVLLHDDAEVLDGWLRRLLAAAGECPEAGILGPLVLRDDGRVRGAGHLLLADATTLPLGGGCDPDDPALAHRARVDYCGGCCLLIRAALWDAAGGLNEALFPTGYGDVHMALAARRLGWTVVCEPRARVIHDDAGGSLPAHLKSWAFTANRDRILEQWSQELAEQAPATGDAEADRRAALERARERGPAAARPLPPAPLASQDELSLLRRYARDADAEITWLRARIEDLEGQLRR